MSDKSVTTKRKEKHQALIVEKIQFGGYLIRENALHNNMMDPIHYACSTLDEAMKYVKGNIQ